jgi:hypothetical protein
VGAGRLQVRQGRARRRAQEDRARQGDGGAQRGHGAARGQAGRARQAQGEPRAARGGPRLSAHLAEQYEGIEIEEFAGHINSFLEKTKFTLSAAKTKSTKSKADKPKDSKAKASKAKAEKAPKVEILRKISAPERVESRQTPESDQALALVRALEAKFEAGELDVLTPEATQALMGVICRIYGANQESGNKYSLLAGRAAVTGTDAMITCSALLKAVDLQVFELGMWQSWSGV